MNIFSRIMTCYDDTDVKPHHRNHSRERCFLYFQNKSPSELCFNRDLSALNLGFYLASWGMYRGSSFLLGKAYTVHHQVVDVIAKPEFDALRGGYFCEDDKATEALVPSVISLVAEIRAAYRPFVGVKQDQPTTTLITKVVLGTFGCLPAFDKFFIAGMKKQGENFRQPNEKFMTWVRSFCRGNLSELKEAQQEIETRCGIRYPTMKLLDMYFFEIGLEAASNRDALPLN